MVGPVTGEGEAEGNAGAREAAFNLLDAALGAKIHTHLGHYDLAAADTEQAGAAVVVLVAALAAAKRAARS